MQPIVAQSATESEYITVAEAVKKRRALFQLTQKFPVIAMNKATIIYEDNQACIAMAAAPGGTRRSKQIDVRYHVSKEAVENGEVSFIWTGTADQAADMLTKNLGRVLHTRHRAFTLHNGASM